MNELRELSLFSGYGGFSLGLKLAGIPTRTVMYVEWEKYPQEIIKARINDKILNDAPIWGNISTLNGEQFRGVVDIITSGFPCPPFSVAGLRKGADDERNLWPETLRIIREVRPRYVLLENVSGILSGSRKRGTPAYGGTVVGELAQAGYRVRWETVGADDVGAPHRRKRWLCFGELADSKCQRSIQCEPQGQSRYQQGLSEGSGGELADAEGEFCQWVEPEGSSSRQPQEEARDRSRDEELADSDSNGQFNQSGSTTRQDGAEGRKECSPNSEPIRDSDARERVSLHETGLGEEAVGRGLYDCEDSNELPTWPPSPSDTYGWGRVLRERPDLAPAITKEAESEFRGVANGRSSRVDRLKALGNGLVPSVVAEFLRRVTM
jgi:DNA (cytosine-5)-methyltransferase 1